MSDFIDRYERQLVSAARARAAKPSWRRVLGPRRIALVGLGSILLGGTALAATQPWDPQLGDGSRDSPTASAQAPPQAQLDHLGVLRRPQTDADRGGYSLAALASLDRALQGVHVSYVRLLHAQPDGRAFLLVPAEITQAGAPADSLPSEVREGLGPKRDQLCVFVTDRDGSRSNGSALDCASLPTILDGVRSQFTIGRLSFGLVPDGVASVAVEFADGRQVEADVRDNFYILPAVSGTSAKPLGASTKTLWRDANGELLRVLETERPLQPGEVAP